MRHLPRPASAVTVAVYVALFAPIVVVIVNSFNADERLISWGGFTLDWYRSALGDDRVRTDALASAQIAVVSTVLAVVIGLSAALWSRRAGRRGRALLHASTLVRFALPEVVVALGLFLTIRRLDFELGFRTIVIGHVVVNSALATVIFQARIVGMDTMLEDAAADLGAGPWRAFHRVTLPQLLPAAGVATLLCLTFSADNVIASQFLGGTEVETLPVLLLGLIRLRVTPQINAIGVLAMTATLITFAAAAALVGLRGLTRTSLGEPVPNPRGGEAT
jgi:ABC-type spermidine/putrescine transport system permease subunit II